MRKDVHSQRVLQVGLFRAGASAVLISGSGLDIGQGRVGCAAGGALSVAGGSRDGCLERMESGKR